MTAALVSVLGPGLNLHLDNWYGRSRYYPDAAAAWRALRTHVHTDCSVDYVADRFEIYVDGWITLLVVVYAQNLSVTTGTDELYAAVLDRDPAAPYDLLRPARLDFEAVRFVPPVRAWDWFMEDTDVETFVALTRTTQTALEIAAK